MRVLLLIITFTSIYISAYVNIPVEDYHASIEVYEKYSKFFYANRVVIYIDKQNRVSIKIDIDNFDYIKSIEPNATISKKPLQKTKTNIFVAKSKKPLYLMREIHFIQLLHNESLIIEKVGEYYTLMIDKVTKDTYFRSSNISKMLNINSFTSNIDDIQTNFFEDTSLAINPFYNPMQRDRHPFIYNKNIDITKNKKILQPILEYQPTNLTPYQNAIWLYKNRQCQKSLDILKPLFLDDLTNNDYSFFIAQNYFCLKRYDEAIAAYDRVLISNPKSLRTKLEVAKTHFFMKKFQTSEDEFKLILEDTVPKGVEKNVKEFLTLIEKYKQNHFFNAILIAGIVYDSNVNNYDDTKLGLQSSSDEIIADNAHQEIVMANYKYRLSDALYLKNDSMLFNKMMFTIKNKDIILGSNTTSLEYSTKDSTTNIGFYYDRLKFGGTWLMHKWAILPKYSYIITPNTRLNTNLKYENRMFINSSLSALDTIYYELNSSINTKLTPSQAINIGLVGVNEIMANAEYSGSTNRQYALNSGYSYIFSKTLTMDLKFNYKYLNYIDLDKINQQYTPSITLTYIKWGYIAQGVFTYTDVKSTNSASQYSKNSIGLTLIKLL